MTLWHEHGIETITFRLLGLVEQLRSKISAAFGIGLGLAVADFNGD